jgi:hypothetical protein
MVYLLCNITTTTCSDSQSLLQQLSHCCQHMHGNNSNNINVSHSNQKDPKVKSDMAQRNLNKMMFCVEASLSCQTQLLNQQEPSSNIKEKMGETDAALSWKP